MFCTTDAPRCEKHQCLAVQSHRRFPLMVRCQRSQVCNNCFRVFVVEAAGWHRWASWQSWYPSPVIKVAGLMRFEKPIEQDGDAVLVEEGNTPPREIASRLLGPA